MTLYYLAILLLLLRCLSTKTLLLTTLISSNGMFITMNVWSCMVSMIFLILHSKFYVTLAMLYIDNTSIVEKDSKRSYGYIERSFFLIGLTIGLVIFSLILISELWFFLMFMFSSTQEDGCERRGWKGFINVGSTCNLARTPLM